MGNPLVYVLVINWNGKEHLEACFQSLLAQTYPNARFFLLDNASTDGSVEYVQSQFGHDERVIILPCGGNLGWSRGNNVGLQRALADGADYAFLLNNDTATAPDAIERLVEFAEQHPNAGAIAPKMLLFDQPHLINSIAIRSTVIASAWDEGLGRLDGSRWSEPKQILGVCGGAMFVRCSALTKTGLLPTDFEIYLDDLDLCLRIWDSGFECWSCPSAAVRHKFGATMGQGKRARHRYYLNTRNRMRLILRNYPSNRLLGVVSTFMACELRALGRAALSGEFWKVAAHLKTWMASIAYVPTARAHRKQWLRDHAALGSFWDKLEHQFHFYPGVELPIAGWYKPRAVQNATVQPISSSARLHVSKGRLRVTHANCYPHLGETAIELRNTNSPIASLSTTGTETVEFDVDGGEVEFLAQRIFEAEQTGESIDIGGWIRCELISESASGRG